MAFSSICLMVVVWTGICYNTTTLYADPVVNALGITRAEFMVTFTIVALTNTFFSLFLYGQIEARLGIRRVLLLGGLLGTAAYVAFTFVSSIPMLYLGGLLYGLALSFIGGNSTAAGIGYWFKKKMGRYISIVEMVSNAVGIVATIVIGALILAIGWRQAFGVTAIISLVGVIAVVLLYKGTPAQLGEKPMYADEAASDAPQEETGITYKQVFKKPQFFLLAVGYFFTGFTVYSVLGDIPLFAVDYGYGDTANLFVSVALVASVITMVPLGELCDRAGSRVMVALALVCTIINLIVFQMPNLPIWAMYVTAALAGVAFNANLIPMGISVREAFGDRDFSKKVGTVSGFSFAGVAFGPTILNLFYGAFGGYTLGLMVYVVLAAIALVCMWFGTRKAY